MRTLPIERVLTGIFLSILVWSTPSFGQSYEDIKRGAPEAVETTLTDNAFVFNAPAEDARPVGRFVKGTEVLAYKPEGFFYSIATKEKGFVGYILVNKLDVEQDPNLVVVSPISNADYRDPSRARILSIALPGGGQVYAGREKKGTVILGGAVLGFVGGYAVSLRNTNRICENDELMTGCRNEINRTGLLAGSAVALGFWAYGIFSAQKDAREYNETNGLVKSAMFYPTLNQNGLGLAMKITW